MERRSTTLMNAGGQGLRTCGSNASDRSSVDSTSKVSDHSSSVTVFDTGHRENFIEWDENNKPRYTRYVKSKYVKTTLFTETFFDHQSGDVKLFTDTTLGSLERKAAQEKLSAIREQKRLQKRREVVEKVREQQEQFLHREKRKRLRERREKRKLKRAVVTVQRHFRKYVHRKWENEREHNKRRAAKTVIVDAFRRTKSRSIMKERLAHYQEQAKLLRAGMELEQVFRRWIDRKRAQEQVEKLRRERDQEREEFMESIRQDASICIQRIFRGFLVRKYMGDIHAAKRMPYLIEETDEDTNQPFFITETDKEEYRLHGGASNEHYSSVPTMCDDPDFRLNPSSSTASQHQQAQSSTTTGSTEHAIDSSSRGPNGTGSDVPHLEPSISGSTFLNYEDSEQRDS
eukprot:gb/GECG01010080.1/.p1 GENE.gb/GECG01010080.1/~~gb/GECG01010080.1/.p1  ORF type:complete len:401 (+),score=65.69 gb/GECG01010080.1/:1-1203(+)